MCRRINWVQLHGFVVGLQGYKICCILLHKAIRQTVVGVLRNEESFHLKQN